TLLEDVGTVALVAAGAGAVIKGISLGAKGAGAASAGLGTTMVSGLRTGLTAARAAWSVTRVPGLDAAFGASMRIAGWTGQVALAPLAVNFAIGRFAAGALSRGLVAPIAGRVLGAAEVTAGRAGAAFELGRYADAVALQAQAARLTRVGTFLERSAYAGRLVGTDGPSGRQTRNGRTPGLLGTLLAYNRLGLRFGYAASAAEIGAGHARATFGLFADVQLGGRGRFGYLGEALHAFRQQRVDRAGAVARYDPGVFGRALRNRNGLAVQARSGNAFVRAKDRVRDRVRAADRAAVLSQIAEGRLSAREYGALTSGGLDRLVESAIADRPAQQAGQQPQAGGQGGTRTVEPPAPGRPRPADPVDGSPTPAPRGTDRFGGGQRPGGGDGPDPLATENPAAGGPRALADEPTPRKPSAGFRTEVNELETDLPPPSGRNGPRVTRFDDLVDLRAEA